MVSAYFHFLTWWTIWGMKSDQDGFVLALGLVDARLIVRVPDDGGCVWFVIRIEYYDDNHDKHRDK